jgi:hypothetical protein
LLENDNWKRVPLSDTKIFDEEKVKEMTYFPLKNLISIFNSRNTLINKSNSKQYFGLVFQNWGSSNYYQTLLEHAYSKEFKLEVFSKPLDFKSLILSTSSVNLTISLKTFLVHLNTFDSIIYDTFLQIFNTFDYYVLH